jgi:hypothetical protein
MPCKTGPQYVSKIEAKTLIQAFNYLQGIAKGYPNMFENWEYGFQP